MNNVEINKHFRLSPHLTSSSAATLGNSSELDCTRLSPHFTLGEMCKTSAKTADGNIPSHVHIENLKRLCGWLEELRRRYNLQYVWRKVERSVSPPELGGARGGLNEGMSGASSDHPTHTGTPPNLGGEEDTPIVINSGYRSEAVNRAVGGAKGSNHLTGCAVDINVAGIEQLVRYATILLDISDESQEDFDELLLERSPKGTYWLHFAVRPSGNRRKVRLIQT